MSCPLAAPLEASLAPAWASRRWTGVHGKTLAQAVAVAVGVVVSPCAAPTWRPRAACPSPPVRLLRTAAAAAPAPAPPALPAGPAGRCRLLPRRPCPPPPLAASAPPLFCSPNIPTAEIPQPDSLSALTVNSGGRLLEPGPWPPPLLARLMTSSSSSSSPAVSSRSCRLRGQPATQPAAGRSPQPPLASSRVR